MEKVIRNKDTEAALDVEKLVNSIEKKLPAPSAAAGGREATSYTIYRAPKALRQVNEKGFEPQLASIGPYHINNEELKAMEGTKLEYLQSILRRNGMRELKEYVEEMKKLEGKARGCYSESISLDRAEFVKMLLLDGCFLVEMFLRIQKKEQPEKPGWCWLRHFISFDMLLLENQLPFFVLETVFCLVQPEYSGTSLAKLALNCFQLLYKKLLHDDAVAKANNYSYHHLLDLFHRTCLPPPTPPPSTKYDRSRQRQDMREESLDPDIEEQSHGEVEEQIIVGQAQPLEMPLLPDQLRMRPRPFKEHWRRMVRRVIWCLPVDGQESNRTNIFAIPSAEQLLDSGIKFKTKENAVSFLGITCEKDGGVIEIPYLHFSDKLKSIFQNLIAYEQCRRDVGTFFTGYAFFMDDLINTAKDVRILRHSGILEHGLGSDEELAQHFNQLSKGVFYDEGSGIYLYGKRKEINKYYGYPPHIWKATLKREYFYSPWAALALGGAILGLALGIFQTALSLYSTLA